MLRVLSQLRTPLPALSNQTFHCPICVPFSSATRRKKGKGDGGDESDGDERKGLFVFWRDPSRPPNLFVVQPRLRPQPVLESKLAEALNLANSLEEPRDGFYAQDFSSKGSPPHIVVQNPATRSARTHADTFFGPGTVDNIKCNVKALETESEIDAVFVNAILSGIQQRNLEVAWGKPVLDRVGLIIEIFNAHAETKEAKLQSELAALMYKKTRLVRVRGQGGRLTFGPSGEAEVVSARGRASGGRGFISGAGETELQLQRRRIQERRNSLLAQIEEVRRTRAIQRSARRRHGGGSHCQSLATVAVVGYTNAGKSTLVSALSDTDLYSDDRLFATVDPRLRSVVLPSGRKAILSDTVGFISDLPVQLVEAFHATLEEVVEADLLVHVLDSSAPDIEEHRSTVLQVLQQIGVSEHKIGNMIEVWNKIDLLEDNMGADAFHNKADDDVASDLSCSEPLDDDDVASADLLLSEPLDDEDDEDEYHDMDPGQSSDHSEDRDYDDVASCADLSISSAKTNIIGFNGEEENQPASCHVKTSAVTGVGLQELLNLIDEKLDEQRTVVQRNYGPFDQKWRPSYSTDSDKVAGQ